ncbi:AraC family transcriptional regulator [Gelidibacter salicanalis]|uniref:AraC family transcriptional regulator n=1 Tax=Gelidibacter salicanalis TaxID=291193 RepID=A0A934KR78_9FLAO|nr:AraC family transcriptional regulator [Gelidibacter salicanalis]MBJ7882039.1 AraC family transcriptional regulator [Gelidibacter salicanalis]
MKLHLIDRSNTTATLSVRKNSYANFLKIWHYHPELELVTVLKSKGTRFIGDSIKKFQPKDVVLIGKNLPHMWLNDPKYFQEDKTLTAEAISIHFREDFLGDRFLQLSEMKPIVALFKQAEQGIQFKNVSKVLRQAIINLNDETDFNKTHQFLGILNELAGHEDVKLLASSGYVASLKLEEPKLSNKVIAYIFKNFNTDMDLATVAELVNMNPSAFSRSFKRVHRKTFSKYVNEIRIGYACKLLMENELNVAAIAYESGFNNLSNFNRQFKVIKNMSPSIYLKKHSNYAPDVI